MTRSIGYSRPLAIFTGVILVVWLIVAAFPFIWTVWGSFKVQADFFSRVSFWNAITGPATVRQTGEALTLDGYRGAWIEREFYHSVWNTTIVTICVTSISLLFGTLGGYALSRSSRNYTFWILIAALVFRAMPHITLVSGFLLPFFQLNIWGYLPTAIIVLVAINQPFTIWMLHSFFKSIPKDLDESAMVDGCTRFQAFRLAIMPVMWPGVITTGLFSFLLAYNDFSVTALLLSQENQTMVPKINSFLGTIQTEGTIMYAVAATVSATVPLFILVMFFQRQIVSGLTAGAVKGQSMAEIQLKNVTKRWGNVYGVNNFNLHIADREFLVLLGPSGCGKSTTMRMIAGLEDISEGEIIIGDRVVNTLEPKDRDIAMVFQSYGLYPNLTVYENIRFPLKVRKVPKDQHDARVMKAAEMVDLTDLLDRRPAELSGGQRQRVALARAIVREPTVFLMDEPLSNLDAKLRVSTRAEIKNLQHRLKTTTIYVTHDQIEAMTLADRVVVMSGGVIQQVATPTEIYDNPANTFVASFIGSPAMNLVKGEITAGIFTAQNIRVEGLRGEISGPVTLGFRAEDVTLVDGGGELSSTVFALELLGDASMVAVEAGGELVNLKAAKDFRSEIGAPISARIPIECCHLFDAQDGRRLTVKG